MNKFEKIRRWSWAILLLILPMFSYPLAWTLPFGKSLPGWDLIHPVSQAVLSLTALAAAIAEPRRLFKAWKSSKLLRGFFVAGILCIAVAFLQQIIYGGLWEHFFYAMFAIAMPWAGIALAPELKRLLPWWCSALFFFLLITTVQTPMCTGFVGNWNWNFTLLAITLVAVVTLVFRSRWRLTAAGVAVSAGVFIVFLRFPEFAPRGTLAGVIGAAVSIGIVMLFKRQERWRYALLAALAGSALFISAVNSGSSSGMANARIQLWRGSLQMALANSVTGAGLSRFESRITPYLPPDYYLSDFPATRHPHPHNELLYVWAGYGLAGIFYFLLCIAVAARQIRRKDPVGLWIVWSFLLLLIHGMFDVHLSTPLAGTLFFLMLGTVCGTGLSGSDDNISLKKRYLTAAFLIFTACCLASLNFRSGHALRQGRLHLLQGKKTEALESFKRSVEIYPNAPAYYMAGQVEFFDFRRPENALFWWSQIKNELRMPSFLHLNRMMGHAYDVIGKHHWALYYFEREARDFPFSAINAGLRLGTLQKMKAPEERIRTAEHVFKRCMQMRNLKIEDFPHLLRNPMLDDEPLIKLR